MFKLFCSLFFIAGSLFCAAQNRAQVDSLLKVVDTEPQDSLRMKAYNRLANYYMDNNPGKAIDYLEKAKAIAGDLHKTLAVANNYYSLGFCYLVKADYEKSLFNYQQSTKLYEQLKDSGRLSNAFMSIGNVFFQNKDIGRTNEYYDKAEVLIRGLNDSFKLASLYDAKGINYDQAGKFDSSLLFAKKAYTINRLIHDDYSAVNNLSNIGLTYKHQFKTAEALANFDSVRIFYEQNNVPADQTAALYNNIAATNAQAGNYAMAINAFTKSINLAKLSGAPSVEMENYRNMSDMYGSMKNFELQAVFQKKYYNLKDSIFTADNKNQLTELEATYQVEKKNTELVKKDAEVSKQKSQRNILMIVAFSILGILATLGYFYNRIKNKNGLLQQKNIQISEQKDELQTLNHVKDRLFSIISHDLRNPLVTLRSYLMLSENDNIAVEKKQQFKLQTMNAVSQTGDMLDNLLAWANVQIKNTRVNIVPLNIDDLVADAVSYVKAQAYQKQIAIHEDLTITMAPGDYDILSIAIRNLLTNAIKYSSVNTPIYIKSVKEGEHILLSVRDEGVGMSKAQIAQVLANQNDTTKGTQSEKGSGLGLFLVRELLQKINAELKIESDEGKGSEFIIVL